MKAKKIILMSSIEYAAFYLCRFNLAPLLVVFMEYFNVTQGEAGSLASVVFISYAIVLIPAGILGDKIGPKKVITFGAVVSGLSTLLFPFTSYYLHALIIQFCNGFGQGMAWGPLTRLMSNWYQKESMSIIISVLSIAAYLGPILAFVMAGYFTTVYGWKTAFWFPSVVLLILTIFFWASVRDQPSGSAMKHGRLSTKLLISSVVSKKDIWLIASSYLCLYACNRGVLIWLPTFLTERAQLPLFQVSFLSGAVTTGGIITMFVGSWLADVRLGGQKKVVIVSAFLLAVPMFIVIPYLMDLSWILLAFCLTFAFLSLGESLYFAYPSILLPEEAVGTASGFIDMLGYVGSFLGTLLIGFLFDFYHSYDLSFVSIAIIGVIGATISLLIKK
jgi:sugar phosphate permease